MQELNEAEMFRSVLNEMLNELKQLHTGVKEMNKTVGVLAAKIDEFRNLLDNLKVEAPAIDLGPVVDSQTEGLGAFNTEVRRALERMEVRFGQGIQKLTEAVEAQPKPIVRRICFFPENDYRGNYKYFMRCLVLGALGLAALVVLASWGHRYFEQRGEERAWPHGSVVYPVEGGTRGGGASSSSGGVRHGKGVKRRHGVDSTGVGKAVKGDSVGYYLVGDSVR